MERGIMNKKTKKIIGVISILCILVLIFDVLFILYKKKNSTGESNYFDSVNAFDKLDKGYITVGSNNGNKDSYEKAKIAKYDDKFQKEWEKFYNHGYNSTFHNVLATDDGYVAVGSFQKTKKEKKENTKTALFVKYDKDGKEEFSRTMQILGNSTFKNVKALDDGYIVVGQSIYENSTLGMSEEGGAIIVKYDKSGDIVWQDHYGGNKSGLYNDLVVTDQYIYVVGKDYGRTGIISKYTLDGTRLQTTTYEYTDTLGFTGITQIGDYLVVAGAKKLSKDEYDHEIDSLLVKYNDSLEKIDEITYDSDGLERFNTLTHDKDNNLIVVGHSAVLNEEKSTKEKNVYRYYGILAKYKENLKEVYVTQYGEGNNDYFTDIMTVKDYYLVSGYSKYKKEGYFSKFITYNQAGKMIQVK